MAQHQSAIKRIRQNAKKRERNRNTRAGVRTAIKKTKTALEQGDIKAARELLREAEGTVARAKNRGVLHHKTASRHIGRLASLVAKAKAA